MFIDRSKTASAGQVAQKDGIEPWKLLLLALSDTRLGVFAQREDGNCPARRLFDTSSSRRRRRQVRQGAGEAVVADVYDGQRQQRRRERAVEAVAREVEVLEGGEVGHRGRRERAVEPAAWQPQPRDRAIAAAAHAVPRVAVRPPPPRRGEAVARARRELGEEGQQGLPLLRRARAGAVAKRLQQY
jgi:hypothetical protein